ncbi:Mor transcription activator family protein [Simonsiella muelleri]|uniref:Mor transcription activator family protein n=1 Tax=Simonsiella muelleri TaxID=72 RepID=UPI0023F26385|nr:Mor transcription activator family protein [Simonsiella muelleri]
MTTAKLTTQDYPEIRHLLPRSVQELIFLTSVESAFILIEHYGGQTLTISQNKTSISKASFQKLAALIGKEHANKLTTAYGGRQLNIFIPRCHKAQQYLRDKKIVARFDEMAKEQLENQAVNALVLEFGLTDRQIRSILKTHI